MGSTYMQGSSHDDEGNVTRERDQASPTTPPGPRRRARRKLQCSPPPCLRWVVCAYLIPAEKTGSTTPPDLFRRPSYRGKGRGGRQLITVHQPQSRSPPGAPAWLNCVVQCGKKKDHSLIKRRGEEKGGGGRGEGEREREKGRRESPPFPPLQATGRRRRPCHRD